MDKTKMAVDVFDKCATEYAAKFMDVNLYSESLNLFCDRIVKQSASILEIACGPGNITRYLLGRRPDFKILGTDLSPNMIDLAKENNPTATFQLMDCRNVGSIGGKYDGVVCGFCFPYLSAEEVRQLISDVSGLLAPEGILFISTMEGEYHTSGWKTSSSGDQLYQYFHEADYLTEVLEKHDFKIIDLQRKEYLIGNEATTDLLIVAGK